MLTQGLGKGLRPFLGEHLPVPEERETRSSQPLLRDQLCLVLPSVPRVKAKLEVTSSRCVPSNSGKFHEPSITMVPRCAYGFLEVPT